MRLSSDGNVLLPNNVIATQLLCNCLDKFKAYATNVLDNFLLNLSPKNVPTDKY
jgi:hypothetical protein